MSTKRDKEIEAAGEAEKFGTYDGGRGYDEHWAFREGANWADANPSPELLKLIQILVDYLKSNGGGVTSNECYEALANFKKSQGDV